MAYGYHTGRGNPSATEINKVDKDRAFIKFTIQCAKKDIKKSINQYIISSGDWSAVFCQGWLGKAPAKKRGLGTCLSYMLLWTLYKHSIDLTETVVLVCCSPAAKINISWTSMRKYSMNFLSGPSCAVLKIYQRSPSSKMWRKQSALSSELVPCSFRALLQNTAMQSKDCLLLSSFSSPHFSSEWLMHRFLASARSHCSPPPTCKGPATLWEVHFTRLLKAT